MLYRIILNEKTTKWVIQVSGYFMLWKTLRRPEPAEVLSFEDFTEALDFVKKSGIDRVYAYQGPDFNQGSSAMEIPPRPPSRQGEGAA